MAGSLRALEDTWLGSVYNYKDIKTMSSHSASLVALNVYLPREQAFTLKISVNIQSGGRHLATRPPTYFWVAAG